MEHSWGRNVSEQGLGDLGATLASHRTGFPPGLFYTNAERPSNTFVAMLVPTDPSIPYIQFLPNKLPGHPHFPYGYAVDADAPL